MPQVTIVSPFRDYGVQLPDYVQRVQNLLWPAEALRVVCVEGDSTDDTWARLQTWALQDRRVSLVKCDTGKPRYGSVIDPERFAALAQVFNAGLNAADLDWGDFVLVLPSDIAYAPDLLQRLAAHSFDLVAPFVWLPDGRFYDTWAFGRRVDGVVRYYGNFPRGELGRLFGEGPVAMETVGGTLLIRADVLRAGCRYTADEVDRGLCRCAWAHGFKVWADPTTHVDHP